MKVGILTYHRSHNFGAVLQACALRKVLIASGFDAEFVDYWPHYRDNQYKLFDARITGNMSFVSRFKAFSRELVIFPEKLIRHRKFERFISKELGVKGDPLKDGSEIEDSYDAIICGSDQIWRYNTFAKKAGFDDVYFGKYPVTKSVKKVSYAASMGIEELDPDRFKQFASLLDNLHYISVREDSLAKIVNAVSSRSVTQVLDPVFLLSKEDWKKLALPIKRKRYLLFYQLLECPEAAKLAQDIARERNLEIVQIIGNIKPLSWLTKVQTTTGPIDFISLIAGAEYVISTSFHGVAFAIIFNRQFFALGFGKNGSRVESLLRGFGILDRFLDGGVAQPKTMIDYTAVDKKLNDLRADSLKFLMSSLK